MLEVLKAVSGIIIGLILGLSGAWFFIPINTDVFIGFTIGTVSGILAGVMLILSLRETRP